MPMFASIASRTSAGRDALERSTTVRPSAASLAELRELGAQGYVRGILERLDRLDTEEPASQAFSEMLRQLVRRFALNEFNRRLEELEHD